MRRRRQPLTRGRQRLALKYLWWARSLARPFKRDWPHLRDDFDSAAWLGLVEAAEAYGHGGRGARFPAFAKPRIVGALRDEQRSSLLRGVKTSAAKPPRFVPMSRAAEAGEGVIRASGPPFDRGADDRFSAMIRGLPASHARVCRIVFDSGLSRSQARRDAGICHAYFHRYLDESLAMLAESVPCPSCSA